MAGEDESGAVRLPPGRHGFSREFVSESQRERLLNGIVEAVAEHGYSATTIGQLIEAAAVSRRTFYEHFSGKDECFLAAYELIVSHLREALEEAGAQPAWPRRVRDQLAVLLELFASDPALARFLLRDSLAAGGEIAARHRGNLRCFAALLRPDEGAAAPLGEAREGALVGGISTLVLRRLGNEGPERLTALLPDLHELVLTAYVGRAEAQRLASEAA